MANTKIGGRANYGLGDFVEKIDSDRILSPGDSGKTFFCEQNASSSIDFVLPKLSASLCGWNAEFVLSVASDYNVGINVWGTDNRAGATGDGGVTNDGDTIHLVKDMQPLRGTATKDLGSLADAAGESFDVTVTGAVLGDHATAAFEVDIEEMIVNAHVRAANTVEVRVQNESGGTLDIASATVNAFVWKDTPNPGALLDYITFNGTYGTVGDSIRLITDGSLWYATATAANGMSVGTGG